MCATSCTDAYADALVLKLSAAVWLLYPAAVSADCCATRLAAVALNATVPFFSPTTPDTVAAPGMKPALAKQYSVHPSTARSHSTSVVYTMGATSTRSSTR